jgi:hypothetical protein
MAEAIAIDLDHPPTGEAQAWVNAEQPDHVRIGCLFLSCYWYTTGTAPPLSFDAHRNYGYIYSRNARGIWYDHL